MKHLCRYLHSETWQKNGESPEIEAMGKGKKSTEKAGEMRNFLMTSACNYFEFNTNWDPL